MRFSFLIILIFLPLIIAQTVSDRAEVQRTTEVSAASGEVATESTGKDASTSQSSGPSSSVQPTPQSPENQILKELPSKASPDVSATSESSAGLQSTSLPSSSPSPSNLPSSGSQADSLSPSSSSPSSSPSTTGQNKANRKRREKTNSVPSKRANENANKDPNKPCPKGCSCNSGVVNCVHAHLTEVPSADELPKNMRALDLSENQIRRLTIMDPMPNLRRLSLRFNQINEIEPLTFQNAPNLRELDLGNNGNISRLPEHLFEPLEYLENLNLDGCNLTGTTFQNNTFKNNAHLKVLEIRDNPLYMLESSFFQHFKELEYLNLMNCRLITIEWKDDAKLGSLKALNVSMNQLQWLPSFKHAPNIEELVLDKNDFPVLNKDSFSYLTNLKNLEISNNDQLINIEELTFAQLTNLERLVITSNPHLFMISKHAFYSQFNESKFSLKELRLTKNALHFLSEDLLANHWAQLQVLDLKMNPWNCDCHLKWLHKYNQTKYVNELRCKSPENISGQYLVKLEPDSLVCRNSLLVDKLKNVIQGFVFLLAFLVFVLAFLLIYVIQDRPNGFARMFGTGGASSTIYYQKANTKEHPILM